MAGDGCTTYYVKRSNREKTSQIEVIDPFDPFDPIGFAQGKTFAQGRTGNRQGFRHHGGAPTVSSRLEAFSFFGTSVSLGTIG